MGKFPVDAVGQLESVVLSDASDANKPSQGSVTEATQRQGRWSDGDLSLLGGTDHRTH